MSAPLSRRSLLRCSANVACAAFLPARLATRPDRFSLVLLGDLHFDREEHHDRRWVERDHPDDLRQIDEYARITRQLTPRLLGAVRRAIALRRESPGDGVRCVVQVGDFVEGLCGSTALAMRQDEEALRFVREAGLGVPFLFTKGNHDVTGPGAEAAFADVFHPFLAEAAREVSSTTVETSGARFAVELGGAQLVFYDAYDPESLSWFEAVAARRTATHHFVIVHPPVVPYGARSSWHLFSSPRDASRRAKLLELLAAHEAFVLSGHTHRFSALVRGVGRRRLVQLSVCSVVRSLDATPGARLSGVRDYDGDQIRVEPAFSPETAAERRAVLEAERPFVRAFEYADLAGYAVLSVDRQRVSAEVHAGVSALPWQTLDLSRLRSDAVG
jgi:hypothetical protein